MIDYTPIFAPRNRDLPKIARDIVFGPCRLNIEETQKCAKERDNNVHLQGFAPIVIDIEGQENDSILLLSAQQWDMLQREITKCLKNRKPTRAQSSVCA